MWVEETVHCSLHATVCNILLKTVEGEALTRCCTSWSRLSVWFYITHNLQLSKSSQRLISWQFLAVGGQGAMPPLLANVPNLPLQKSVESKCCIALKLRNIMCKCAKSFPRPSTGTWPLDHSEALWSSIFPSCIKWQWVPLLWLHFGNYISSAPNSWRTRNQRHRFMAGWHWQKFLPQFIFTV